MQEGKKFTRLKIGNNPDKKRILSIEESGLWLFRAEIKEIDFTIASNLRIRSHVQIARIGSILDSLFLSLSPSPLFLFLPSSPNYTGNVNDLNSRATF